MWRLRILWKDGSDSFDSAIMSIFLILMYGWSAYAFGQLAREAFSQEDGELIGWLLLVMSAMSAALFFVEVL